MSEPAKSPHPVVMAALRLTAEVEVEPFSVDGMKRLHRHVGAYIDELVLQSVTVMRRHDASQVTAGYVDIAIRNIRSRRRTFGGVLMEVTAGIGTGIVGTLFCTAAADHARTSWTYLSLLAVLICITTLLVAERAWHA